VPETTERVSTVLVVDDSAFMRKLIAEIIESSGVFHVVGTAGDGVEALQKIRTLKPDIVTLDIEMPRLNGLQALEQIMAEMPRPVVMLSAGLLACVEPARRALRISPSNALREA